jgi:cytochrome c oxidase subunit 2
MKILTQLRNTTFIIATFIVTCFSSYAQTAEDGAKLFSANCTSCHSINEKVVGPPLKNVHKKYDEAWIIKWVKNSQEFIKSGDAKAVKVFEENNKIPMTSFANFTDIQIKSIVAFIKAESEKAPVTANASVVSNTASDNESDSVDISKYINWLIVFIVLLFIVVIGLIITILEKLGDIKGKPAINWIALNGILLLLFLFVGMAAVVWEFYYHTKLTVNAQTPASAHGAIYDSMFNITLVLTGIMFVVTQVLLFWYGYRYKHSDKRKALYYPDNHKLEFIWTIIPAVVLTILVVRGLQTWSSITDRNQNDKAQVIEVFGYQFDWKMRYSGADNKLGAHDFRKMGVWNELGVDTNDIASKDDIVTSELHLKVGQPVVLKFRAKDVIHSAYLPHFRVQMNVVPGLPTQFIFTPTVTTNQMREIMKNPNFDYVLLCNKICGSAHYRMNRKVIVESAEDYNKWLNAQPKLVASNSSDNNSKTLASK